MLDATTVTGNGGGNTLTGGIGLDLFYDGNLVLDTYTWWPQTETFISVQFRGQGKTTRTVRA